MGRGEGRPHQIKLLRSSIKIPQYCEALIYQKRITRVLKKCQKFDIIGFHIYEEVYMYESQKGNDCLTTLLAGIVGLIVFGIAFVMLASWIFS